MPAVDTSDPAVAAEALARSFPGLHLPRNDSGEPFRFFHSRETRGFITYSRMNVRGMVRTIGNYPDEFAVARRLGGRIRIDYGAESLDTTGPYLRPQGESIASFHDSRAELTARRLFARAFCRTSRWRRC